VKARTWLLLVLATTAVAMAGYYAGASTGRWLDSRPLPTILPEELADAESLAALAHWSALPAFGDGIYRQQSSHDRGRGSVPNPLWLEGNRDMNNFICASADSEPAADEPFVLDLDKCPEAYVRGYVMARFKGSGRLARMWLTAASLRHRPADRETLRI